MAARQLEKTYDPKQVEARWSQYWSDRRYFHADVHRPGGPFSIVIPPPNVTGSLHIGHALNTTLQDILIRWRRMEGRNTLWLPGTDHAGIATQNVVEKQVAGEGTTREALGREAFVARVWEWKAKSGGAILQQLKALGASCDWDRLRFTMDEGLSKAVREVFVRLFEDGLLYRGERLINWCPRCLTALSDIEVEHEDTAGTLYYIHYPLADDPAMRLTVATTRPETLLGDTAVAVHPEDPRYQRLIGRKVTLPLTSRTIPIVGDPILVNREFGTGAVKITPAHDFNDFEAGERHRLPRIAILDEHAHMDGVGLQQARVDATLDLASKPVREARAVVVQALRDRGFLAKVEDHKMALGKCYRCKTVVEPYLSPQWFVKITPLAEPAIEAVEDGRIRLVPEGWVNNYLGWMRDIKDWCISRQIWWGHQIPAWYCRSCNQDAIVDIAHGAGAPAAGGTPPAAMRKTYTIAPDAKPIVARMAPAHCPDCSGSELIRDPDVLDTWFSSALWPFSTLGWPEQTSDLKTYYPTSVLVTGLDILFFWVARMIMMGLKFTNEVPFREVYIHALVRDVEGQKMSKSKGNVIDPLTVMNRYGTDALRFTLAAMASPGRDIRLAEERIEGYRNFANKLWNAARFILMHLEGPRAEAAGSAESDRPMADRWIMSRLQRCIGEVVECLTLYRFDEAAHALYQFIWHDYCDWYLELAKPALADPGSRQATLTRQTLVESFETVLRLLHPFMPFITEEIWQTLPHTGDSVMVAPYPTPNPALIQKTIEEELLPVQRLVSGVRDIRGAQGISPNRKAAVTVRTFDDDTERSLNAHAELIVSLGRLGDLSVGKQTRHPQTAAVNVVTLGGRTMEVGIVLDGLDLTKETARIQKRLGELAAQRTQIEGKLSNPEFVSKAPPDVLEKNREKLRAFQTEQEKLSSELARLRGIAGGAT